MLGISYKALLYKVRQFGLDAGRTGRTTSKETSKTKTGSDEDSIPAGLAPAGRHH